MPMRILLLLAALLMAGTDAAAKSRHLHARQARATIVDNWKYLDFVTKDWPTMELLLRLAKE